MTIEVRLFGQLRHYAGDGRAPAGTALYLDSAGTETTADLLARLGIAHEEVGNLFVNGRLLPRSIQPFLLGYPLAAPEPLSLQDWLAVAVSEGDRVGIFPRNMCSVVV